MIKMVCPKCERPSGKVKTKFTIQAIGYTRIVASRERGVEQAVASPIEVVERTPRIEILPDAVLVCSRCAEETTIKLWKYLVYCDSCGELITRKSVKDPSRPVDKHICRDTMTILCDECWSHSSNREYCPSCRYRDSCLTYKNR